MALLEGFVAGRFGPICLPLFTFKRPMAQNIQRQSRRLEKLTVKTRNVSCLRGDSGFTPLPTDFCQ